MRLLNTLLTPGVLLCGIAQASTVPQVVLHNSLQSSNEHNLISSELMLPLSADGQRLYYGLVSGVLGDNDSQQLGLGIGMRQRIADAVAGGYLIWDYQNGAHGSQFQQLTAGAEWQGQRWQLYGNIYLPFSRDAERLSNSSRTRHDNRVAVRDGELQMAREQWQLDRQFSAESLAGADLEAGYRIPLNRPGLDWQMFAGALYRSGRATGDFNGGWVGSRLMATDLSFLPAGSQAGIELQARYDQHNHDDYRALLTLSVPFGGTQASGDISGTAFFAPVRRQHGIEVERFSSHSSARLVDSQWEALSVAETGQSLAGLSVARADQQQSLQAAVDSGAELILVDGQHALDDTLALNQPGQWLLGAGTELVGETSGQRVVAGQPGQISAAVEGRPVVNITADNVRVSQLTISNEAEALASTGVMVEEADNVLLENLKVNTVAHAGFGVVQYGGSGMLRDSQVQTGGRAAHGVFAMADGALDVTGRYDFNADFDNSEDGSVSLTGTIQADYIDSDGDRISTVLAQNIDDYQPSQVAVLPAGMEIDGETLDAPALLINGGAITAETLLEFAHARHLYPQANSLIFGGVEGSADDVLNLELGRAVHDAGFATHLVSDGVIASGAVDLFLAGVERSAGDQQAARFGVHSWGSFDSDEPTGSELPRNHPAHQAMLSYFNDVQINPDFYWFTLEAAPFDEIHWMTAAEISQWNMLTR